MIKSSKLLTFFTSSTQPDKYKALTSTISNRFGDDAQRTIPVRNIALPNLQLPMELPYNDQFSLFVPKHRTMAAKLIDIFLGKLLSSAF